MLLSLGLLACSGDDDAPPGGTAGTSGAGSGAGGTAGSGGTAGAAGSTSGAGGTAGTGGVAGNAGAGGSGVTISEACLTCAASDCKAEFDSCVGNSACFACADGDPTTEACKQNAAFQAVLACACKAEACGASACATECSQLVGGAGGAAGAGGSAGSAGSAGDGGSAGAGGDPGPTAFQGTALVSGGTVAKSSKYTLVTTTGQAPGGNGVAKSSKYQLRGGLVGVTQP
ncbi:MAG: hypothetical protein MUF64_16815 [Polyangiaceae bacterium]|nr:hypothetical protein [Polyangiaceae bacterium]